MAMLLTSDDTYDLSYYAVKLEDTACVNKDNIRCKSHM